MSKKVCVSGYYGFSNFGDEAILDVIVDYLKSKNADITIFSKNPVLTATKHRVKCVNSFDILGVMRNIKNCDVLFSGGGSLLQDKTSLKSLLYYLFVIIYALMKKKQVVIFAQGIGPIKNKIAQIITAQTLKKCDIVTIRDDASLFLVRGWGVLAEKVNDPIWNLPVSQNYQNNKIGVQLRKDKYLTPEYLDELASLILHYFNGYEVDIFSYQDTIDYEICKEFRDILRMKNPACQIKLYNNMTNKEILERTSELKYMVGMRFHACLLALKFGIKTIAINYDVKVKTLASEFSIPCMELTNPKMDYCFSQVRKLSRQEILTKANEKRLDLSIFDRFVE